MKRYSWLVCSVFLMSSTFVACGDDDQPPSDAGVDASDNSNNGTGGKPHTNDKDAGDKPSKPDKDSGPGNGDPDAGNPPRDAGRDATTPVDIDAGDDEDGGPETAARMFHVPSGGGEFEYTTPSGVKLTFDFPASAAGKDITITALDPGSVTFADDEIGDAFSEVIELGPSGTTFSEPVKVQVGKGALIAFNFHDPEEPGDPLLLSADGESLELTHFSTLAVVSPNQSCQSESGWNDVADDALCVGHGSATTRRSYGCKNYAFCYVIHASCCVAPGDTDEDCQLGDDSVQVDFIRTGNNGGDYAYCDHPGGSGSGPYVQGYSPATLVAGAGAQQVTLTGTNFDPNGGFVINGDTFISFQPESSTIVHGIVPASALTTAGMLNMVGFVNPTDSATGACAAATPGNCDFVHRSNFVSIEIDAP